MAEELNLTREEIMILIQEQAVRNSELHLMRLRRIVARAELDLGEAVEKHDQMLNTLDAMRSNYLRGAV